MDENEAVNHILQVIRRDEIAIGINYERLGESDSHKDDRATKRHRDVLVTSWNEEALVWSALHLGSLWNYLSEEKV